MNRAQRTPMLLITTLLAAVLAVWVAWPRTSGQREPESSSPSPPLLFGPPGPCPQGPRTSMRAERFELEGRLLAARAAYDPHDGVLAAARLRLAESCFRAAGRSARAERAALTARKIQARIEGDFAASHSALSLTIDGGRWELARDRVAELLRITAHVGEHPYVSWLESIAGKVAADADWRN